MLHPETRHGGDRKSSGQVGHLNTADRLIADTAAKTGQSERAVRRDATRGECIAEDVLRVVAGTALDKIVRLPVEQQRQLARRAWWRRPSPYH
jgi:hypothetical protein